eukprot:Amastigsp_a3487_17.p5 type:complete len:145 gc:universal Amastigsp_a3487_17:765-1199(+)
MVCADSIAVAIEVMRPPLVPANLDREQSVSEWSSERPCGVSVSTWIALGGTAALVASRKVTKTSSPALPVAAGIQQFDAVMRFWVRVPVLSEQITDTEPRVSTCWSVLTTTFDARMRLAAMNSVIATVAGRPCGTLATKRPMAS